MNFWNDYEGKILDEKYPLQKLLYPEGRSGFFTTSNGTGTPGVVRLTESLNDEKDTFEQWETVRRLNHPHLVAIRSYGQTILDDTPLLFAVLEPSDTSLADILNERPMTADETRQIASSVLGALKELHAAGLFHGHLEPGSVLAVGEVVKLRSDCVRKLPAGNDGERLKALEIQDFATLLLEALTQQRRQQKAALPVPFDRIVRNGTAGTWGIKEISEALELEAPAAAFPTPTPASTKALSNLGALSDIKALSDAPDDLLFDEPPAATVVERRPQPIRPSTSSAEPAERWPRRSVLVIVTGAISLLLIVGVFYFLHHAFAKHPATPNSVPLPASNTQPAPSPTPTTTPLPVADPSAVAAQPSETITPSGAQIWRVVAYTYNNQEQAQHKVSSIEEHHSGFDPEVFTPNGHAPYLVTLGGPMSHDEAVALRRKAKAEGFPRDTYAQNYMK